VYNNTYPYPYIFIHIYIYICIYICIYIYIYVSLDYSYEIQDDQQRKCTYHINTWSPFNINKKYFYSFIQLYDTRPFLFEIFNHIFPSFRFLYNVSKRMRYFYIYGVEDKCGYLYIYLYIYSIL
jgi:Ca2+/Na+ antiporter